MKFSTSRTNELGAVASDGKAMYSSLVVKAEENGFDGMSRLQDETSSLNTVVANLNEAKSSFEKLYGSDIRKLSA